MAHDLKKLHALVQQFAEDVSLETFQLNAKDTGGLLETLARQNATVPALIAEFDAATAAGADLEELLSTVLAAMEAREKNAELIQERFRELRLELRNLRNSVKRLQDWKKAWVSGTDAQHHRPTSAYA